MVRLARKGLCAVEGGGVVCYGGVGYKIMSTTLLLSVAVSDFCFAFVVVVNFNDLSFRFILFYFRTQPETKEHRRGGDTRERGGSRGKVGKSLYVCVGGSLDCALDRPIDRSLRVPLHRAHVSCILN